jgi:putative transposase
MGVPRSTAYGWLRRAPLDVTTGHAADPSVTDLRRRVARLEKRVKRLAAVLRLLFVLFRVIAPDLSRVRFVGLDKARLLRAIDRTRDVIGLRRILTLMGLSLSRFHAWRRAEIGCCLEDQPSCPKSSPQRLTAAEVMRMRHIATSEDYRHVPTGRLALLAQRLGAVFASPSTWIRFVRLRGWRRPRTRVYPHKPRQGVRAETPNQLWHVDTTILKLLDGTRAYLHAVIDNFSRRILAWRVTDRICSGTTVEILIEAGKNLAGVVPTVLTDQGSENVNAKVDALIEGGVLRRLLAQVEVGFSNSMIEAFWRSTKHNWLFINDLDNLSRLRSLVAFYVTEHNSKIPHSAFQGQTPDEMYSGTGEFVPERLARERAGARETRIEFNRSRSCATCA